MDLSSYLKIVLRWWWLVALSVALSATASYFYSQGLPKIYAARTTLMVGSNIIDNPNPDLRNLGSFTTLASVYGELAKRKLVTQAVIDKLGLEFTPDQLSEMIDTNVIPTAQLLEIFVMDVHPQRAQILANAIAEELILQSPTGSGEQLERDKFIRAQLADLQTKIEQTDQRIKELETLMDNLTSAVEIAETQSKLSELEKLKSDYQTSYNTFLGNVSEAAINRLAIFEPAVEPVTPVAPNIKINVLVAAAAGLALAISAIILLEFFSDTITWQQGETQSILGMPVLGAVNKLASNAGPIVPFDKLWSPDVNALRSVRDSIFLAIRGKPLSTLLITSTISGEGKSFLSTNLAVITAAPASNLGSVIASSGSKVILVDADLRKPSLHETFDMPNVLGLADILAMPEIMIENMLKKALKPTHINNLMLLSAGRNPFDPGSLVSSPTFLKLLDALKAQADLVIIDSGPISEVIETKIIANVVDGVVLVVSDGRSRRRIVQRAVDYFMHKPEVNFLGLIFNRVNLSPGYGYASYYANTSKPGQSETRKPSRGFWRKLWPFAKSHSTETTMLNLVEVADYLGITPEMAKRWCEQGRIPAVKKGRKWAIQLEDLNEFVGTYQRDNARDEQQMAEVATRGEIEVDSLHKSPNGQPSLESSSSELQPSSTSRKRQV